MPAKQLILYSAPNCHLCDDALSMLQGLNEARNWHLEKRDIYQHSALTDRYGLRIPVLQRQDTGQELGWPFDIVELTEFLS